MSTYFILNKDKDVIPATALEMAEWRENNHNIVRRTIFTDKSGEDCTLSTVFLCIDHGFHDNQEPLVFETMLFKASSGWEEKFCHRYSTWDQALTGHNQLIDVLIKKGLITINKTIFPDGEIEELESD